MHLTRTGARTICSLAVWVFIISNPFPKELNNTDLCSIRKSLRLVVCDATGWVGLYSLDQEEGGDCSLIRQFLLIDSDTGEIEDIETEPGTDSGNASDSGNVSETGSRSSPAPGECWHHDIKIKDKRVEQWFLRLYGQYTYRSIVHSIVNCEENFEAHWVHCKLLTFYRSHLFIDSTIIQFLIFRLFRKVFLYQCKLYISWWSCDEFHWLW